MEVSISSGITTSTWEYCPEEILWQIFRKLDYKSLVSCITVNRRWNNIVFDYIEHYCLWSEIISATTIQKDSIFKRKSILGLKEIWINSVLWTSVRQAKIALHHIYAEQNVTCIHVYKDKMILTTDMEMDKPIKYFNITNSELQSVASPVKTTECRENDHMFVYFGPEFRVYGKMTPEDKLRDKKKMIRYVKENIIFYIMIDNVCYIYISTFCLVFALTWNGKKWRSISRGRYYGNTYDTVCGINVFNDRVCLVTKLGYILCEEVGANNYHKVNSHNLLARIQDSSVLEMFDYNKVAVAVSNNSNQRVTVCHTYKTDFMWLSCENMTCIIQHGAVLLMGFKDGAVAIYTPPAKPYNQGQMNRLFNVKDFDSSIQHPSICGLEVFEDKMSHHLFVVTRDNVLELLFTYPKHITVYYE